MPDAQDLYRELKDDLNAVADPLFEFASGYVQKYGHFLPVGASLTHAGEVVLQAGSNGRDIASSTEILPILHDTLRASAAQQPTAAVAVCEWVKITRQGHLETDAIKVLVEHERGLSIAFYLPCRRRRFRGWDFGDVFAVIATPEVRPWSKSKSDGGKSDAT